MWLEFVEVSALRRFQGSCAVLSIILCHRCHSGIVWGRFARAEHQSQTCIAQVRCSKDAEEAILCQIFIFFAVFFFCRRCLC